MAKTSTSFDQLSGQDKKTATELAAVASLLVTRLPQLTPSVFETIAKEFAATYNIPTNLVDGAMSIISEELFKTSWEFQIRKNLESEIHTEFTAGTKIESNGDPLDP